MFLRFSQVKFSIKIYDFTTYLVKILFAIRHFKKYVIYHMRDCFMFKPWTVNRCFYNLFLMLRQNATLFKNVGLLM